MALLGLCTSSGPLCDVPKNNVNDFELAGTYL